MNAREELGAVARKLAAQATDQASRQTVMQSMFEQRYGAQGPGASGYATIGARYGVSRQAVHKVIERMRVFRSEIAPRDFPTLGAFVSAASQCAAPTLNLAGLDPSDLTRLANDLWGSREKVLRAPKTPRTRLSAEQFEVLVSMGAVRSDSLNCLGARLILVGGLSLAEATAQLQVSPTPLAAATLRVARMGVQARVAYRRATLHARAVDPPQAVVRHGRKPVESLLSVTPKQMAFLLRVGIGREGTPAVAAAQEVLTQGSRIVDAAQRHSVTMQQVNNARQRLARAHIKLVQAFSASRDRG